MPRQTEVDCTHCRPGPRSHETPLGEHLYSSEVPTRIDEHAIRPTLATQARAAGAERHGDVLQPCSSEGRGNLCGIRLDENLIKPGGPTSPFWLVFPHYDVKNRVDLEFALGEALTKLIEEYIHEFRPVLLRRSPM